MALPSVHIGVDADATAQVIHLATTREAQLRHYASPVRALREQNRKQPLLVLIDASVIDAALTLKWPQPWRLIIVTNDNEPLGDIPDKAMRLGVGATHIVSLPNGESWLGDLLVEHSNLCTA